MTALSPAQLIAGRYKILEEIGHGGMGIVYRATDTHSQETVAIKALHTDLTGPEIIARFVREGEALRKLNHPNIVKMLAAVEENQQHFLVMEYMPGGSLRDVLEEQEQLSVQRTLEIALDLSDALVRAHHLHIIHRDLKPANVLLAADDTPRLTDFGCARLADTSNTESGILMGTFGYLSPETLNSDTIDHRTDIWSFGITLFEMLIGKRPFESQNPAALITSILNNPVPDIEKLRPDVPVALADLIYRMLAKNPAERMPGVRLIGAELEALLKGSRFNSGTATSDRSIFQTPPPVPVQTVAIPGHNIPAQTTPFIGRESEQDGLRKLLFAPENRLITILAPGGMGKTRLSLEIAMAFIHTYSRADSTDSTLHFRPGDGVYLAQLAPLISADDIPTTIADAVGYQFQADGRDQQQQIIDFFQQKSLLLILDNFEHVVDGGADFVSRLLKATRQLKILATSRERLNLSNELVFNLDGMHFPDWETPEDALEYSAVKLFMDSARRVRPEFELMADDLTYVARICRLVQGMPLGIVLAAAWLEMLPLAEIAEEMTRSLDFLETDMRDIPERHRSIRAVFDYSWEKLTEQERTTFMKLSVFRGGFTRKAAQDIAGASLRTLMNLTNKSLIKRSPHTGYYDVHEMLRQYAEEQLNQSGAAAAIRDAHSRYYLTALANDEENIKGNDQLAALNDIEEDFENIRNAWQWAVQQKQKSLLYRAAETLFIFCWARSRYQEAIQLFGMVKDAFTPAENEEPPLILAVALARYGYRFQGQKEETLQAIAIAEKYDSKKDRAFGHFALGFKTIASLEYDEAIAALEKAIDLYQELEDSHYLAYALGTLGFAWGSSGNSEKFNEYTQQSVDLCQQTGNKILGCLYTNNLASGYFLMGRYEEAEKLYQQAVSMRRELKDYGGLSWSFGTLAETALQRGDLARARQLISEADALATRYSAIQGILLTKTLNTIIAGFEGDSARCQKLSDEVKNATTNQSLWLLLHWGLSMAAIMQQDYQTAREYTRQLLDYAQKTSGLSVMAQVLPMEAVIHIRTGQSRRAVEILGCVSTLPDGLSGWTKAWPEFQSINQEALQTEFQTEWQQGKNRTPADLIAVLFKETQQNAETA